MAVLMAKSFGSEVVVTKPAALRAEFNDIADSLAACHEKLTALTEPCHPEHQSMSEWHGDAFDPAFVDVVAISLALLDIKI